MQDIRMLVLDIDGTVLDDSRPTEGLGTLRYLVEQKRDQIRLVFATGRSLSSTMALVEKGILFPPDAIAALVGTELWVPPWDAPDPIFERIIQREWNRDQVTKVLSTFTSISPQPVGMQNRWKVSSYLEDDNMVPAIEAALSEHGVDATVLFSHGKFLDVIPKNAGKHAAINYLRKAWKIEPSRVLVGGNSGNDIDMLEDPRIPGVVVGNGEDELQDLSEAEQVHQADAPFAAGVLEGAEVHAFWPRI